MPSMNRQCVERFVQLGNGSRTDTFYLYKKITIISRIVGRETVRRIRHVNTTDPLCTGNVLVQTTRAATTRPSARCSADRRRENATWRQKTFRMDVDPRERNE